MKLKSLSLRNFKHHTNLTLQTPKFTVITGPNAAGKTSILEALTWALTGKTRRTDGRGAGADGMILDGQPVALVEATFEGAGQDHIIQRAIPHKLSVDGSAGTVTRAEELLRVLLSPLDQSRLLLLLEDQRILQMSDKDRRGFLAEVIGIGAVNRAVLEKWLGTQSMTTDVTNQVLSLFDKLTMKDYRSAYDARTLNNRLLNVQLPEEPGPRPIHDQESLYTRKQRLQIELNLATAQVNENVVFLRRFEEEPIRGQVRNLEAVRDRLKKDIDVINDKIKAEEQRIASMNGAKDRCPIFDCACPLAESETTGLMAFAGDNITRLQAERAKQEHLLQGTEKSITETVNRLAEVEEINRKYHAIAGDLMLEGIRAKPDVEAELAKVASLLTDIENWNAKKAVYDNAKTQLEKAKDALANEKPYDILVKALSPEGVTSMLLADHLRKLEAIATHVSNHLTNGRCEVHFSIMDGQLDISLVSGGRKRDLKALSNSESIWMSLIIRHIANLYTGNRILTVDEATILDANMQTGLEKFLSSDTHYETVVICGTSPQTILPGLPADQTNRIQLG